MTKILTYKHHLLSFLKILIGLAAVYYLWQQQGLKAIISGFSTGFSIYFLVIAGVFSLSNWLMEIKKWQFLVSQVKKINFGTATYQSLSGFAVSMLTPNRIGEYGVKILFFEPSLRKKIFSLSLIGNLSQLLATLLFGLTGIILVLQNQIIQISKIIDFTYFTWLWIGTGLIILYVAYKKWIKNKNLLINNKRIWSKSLQYAILRYLIFATQFYLFFRYFGIDSPPVILFSGIFLMYLLSTLVPMLAFLDWAVKGSVAVWVFAQLGIDDTIVLRIVGLMWFFNFFLPFVAGIIIYTLKSNKKHPKL